MRRYLVLLAAVTFIAGCGVDLQFPWLTPPDDTPDVGEGKSSLKKFDDQEEFENYFAGQVRSQNSRYAGGWDADDALDGEFSQDNGAAPPAPEAPGAGASPTDSTSNTAVDAAPIQSDDDGHSTTTTQEEGVDEADVVKTDGDYLFVIEDDELHIVKALPVSEMAEVATVQLDGDGIDLYLVGDTLVAMTAVWGGWHGGVYMDGGIAVDVMIDETGVAGVSTDGEVITRDRDEKDPLIDSSDNETPGNLPADEEPATQPTTEPGSEPVEEPLIAPAPDGAEPDITQTEPYQYTYERPKTIVTVIDITDRSAPQVISTTKFEGTHATSRMINGVLHLVVSNYPTYYFDVIPLLGRTDLDPADVQSDAVIPRYEQVDENGETANGELVPWNSLYRPTEPDGFGITTIISMDVDTPADFKSVGIVAEPGLIYSSQEALYLTNTNWYWQSGNLEDRESTDIYKFRYTDDGAVPEAVGNVPGRILNQYSMGEHNGYLRVATTVSPMFFFDGEIDEPASAVYVLQQQEDKLEVAGSIEDIAPGETIQSARFMGDRGYVVTFEQIDPLFTLDLSDPTNPYIAGELKVPGFSTFIVPMDENHLLTVGQYIPEQQDDFMWQPWGVQMSIFDITDFENPVQKFVEIIGENNGAHSEALYDPKAFTYYSPEDLVGLPVNIWGTHSYDPTEEIVEMLDELLEEEGYTDIDWKNFDRNAPENAELVERLRELIVEWLGMDDGRTDPGEPVPVDTDLPADGVDEKPDIDDDPDNDVSDSVTDSGESTDDLLDMLLETLAGDEPVEEESFDGIAVYDVTPEAGFAEVGRITTEFDATGWWSWSRFTRCVFSDGHVFAVTSNGVRAANLDSMDSTVEIQFEVDESEIPEMPSHDPGIDTDDAPDSVDTNPTAGDDDE